MRTFIQLKDGIGFAVVNTEGETDGIEVEFGSGEQYLKKSYKNGKWESADLIWFAEIGYDGTIIEIRKTYYASEVGDNPILTPDIKPHFRYINGAWEDPSPIIVPLSPTLVPTNVVIPNEEGELNETTGDTV